MDIEDAAYSYCKNNPPELLDDLSEHKVNPDVAFPAGCTCCGRALTPENAAAKLYEYARLLRLGLCSRCYRRLLLQGTVEGRRSVEMLLWQSVPMRYRFTDLSGFMCFSDHLAEVYNKVVRWCQAAIRGEPVGSLYLFSEPGDWGTGCGNGKSMLLWSAYKRLVRFTSMVDPFAAAGPIAALGPGSIVAHALACDMSTELFDRFIAAGCDVHQALTRKFQPLMLGENVPAVHSIDDFVEKLVAPLPFLFLDDIGRDRPGGMAAGLYEKLLDIRASSNLPTFVTSNYGRARLGQRIGDRAVSRLLRTDCTEIEVRAPDFATVKDRLEPA